MTAMTHRVFVYGTLKRGYSNHPMLATVKEFLGDVATINTYRMLTMIHPSGMFPVILDDPNGSRSAAKSTMSMTKPLPSSTNLSAKAARMTVS